MPLPNPGTTGGVGNAWHIPRNVEPPGTMRDPVAGISPGLPVSIFSGNQFRGPGAAGNQLESGSTVFFRKAETAAWTALPMTFRSASWNNKYYVAVLPTDLFRVDDEVQYYLKIPYSDHVTTFLHGSDGQSFATAKESEAQAAPFSFVVTESAAKFLTLDSGPLQGRVFMVSGQLALAGPDLAATAHANAAEMPHAPIRQRGQSPAASLDIRASLKVSR